MLLSDVLLRFARERVPTIASASPHQIVKPTAAICVMGLLEVVGLLFRQYRSRVNCEIFG